ncbi:MAG: hypothetical protein ACTHN5_18810 [Phycisphaerae bacterium]
MRRILYMFLLLTLAAPLARAATPSHEARIASLRTDLESALTSFQQNLAKPDFHPEPRALTYTAHCLLALGHPAAEAEPLLQKAFDSQNMDPLSPNFGTFPWQLDNPAIKDPNAVEFTAKPLAPIFLLYGDKLSDQFKHDATRHLQAAAQAILHHKVPLDYTNIFLMKCANLYSLGLILNDRSLQLSGIKGFREWFAFTRAHGLTEYNSPTYANTQLACLLQTERLPTPPASPTLKKELDAALDFLWTDLAANTFLNKNTLGGAQLAGPFSRTYDFLSGSGPFDRFLYAESLRDTPPTKSLLVDSAEPLLNELEHGYRPDQSILQIPHLPERTLHESFGDQPGQDRTTYLTPNFAIGSASASRGQQDRQLSISLAELTPGKTLCDISALAETLDNPYGNKKLPDRTGHQKPTPLKPAAAITQDNATLLALLDLAPSQNADLLKPPPATLSTDILFPANADSIFLDGKPLTHAPNQTLPITNNSWLILREGKAAAALRIFQADAVGGVGGPDNSNTPQFFIKYDNPASHTARLVAYHCTNNTAPIPNTPIRAGLLLLAHDCPTPDFPLSWNTELHAATLSHSTTNNRWSATFTDHARQLTATLNLTTHHPERRTINNIDYHPAIFTLNNEDKTTLLPTTP